jgi:hypothetical protein
MNKEILKLSLVLIVVLLFHNCQTIKDEKLSTYKGLFEKSEKYTRAEYDSVYTFYKHLDSIQSSNKSPIIFYLKKDN